VKPVLALAALLLLAAGCGPSQQDRIRSAIRSSPDTQAVRSEGLTVQVSQIQIAHSDPHFATALVRSYDRQGREAVTEALAILHRTDRWRVVELGSAMVYLSCDQTPRAVIMELFAGWCYGARGSVKRLR
jgi:hypothetical protein